MIAPTSFAEPRRGDAVRAHALAFHLAKETELTLVTGTPPGEFSAMSVSRRVKEHVFISVQRVGSMRILLGTLRGLSYDSARFSVGLVAGIPEIGYFDAVWLETPRAWDVLRRSTRHIDHFLTIADLQNDDHDMWQQRATAESFLPARLLSRWYASRSSAKFRMIGRSADLMFCVSQRDADALTSRDGSSIARKTFIVPNGVELQSYKRPAAMDRVPRSALFLGSLDTRMNQIAVRTLIDAYWPALLRRVPDATLIIAGKDPPPWLLRINSQSVRIIASPPDVRPLLWTASVLFAPFAAGSGTKIKVIEAMAAGLPVVGTNSTFQGLPVQSGVHCIAAEDPESASTAVRKVFDDQTLAEGIAGAAYAVVEKYDWHLIAANALRLLADGLLRARTQAHWRPHRI
jgi:glycosyltransferase involved in cell wall biosynthesis